MKEICKLVQKVWYNVYMETAHKRILREELHKIGEAFNVDFAMGDPDDALYEAFKLGIIKSIAAVREPVEQGDQYGSYVAVSPYAENHVARIIGLLP